MTTVDTVDPAVDDAEISAFFAADPATIAWPYPMYERWREGTGVVRWQGGPATLITHHADVKAVMGGAYPIGQNAYRFGELAEGTIRRLPAAQHEVFFKVLDFEGHFMSRQDATGHARLRRISSRAFTARRIEMLRESIQGHVDDLVDEMVENPDTGRQAGPRQQAAGAGHRRPHRGPAVRPRDDLGVVGGGRRLFSLDETSLREADEAIDAFRGVRRRDDPPGPRHRRGSGAGPADARPARQRGDDRGRAGRDVPAHPLRRQRDDDQPARQRLPALQRHRDQWDLLVRRPRPGPRGGRRADALRLAAPLPAAGRRGGLRAARRRAPSRADGDHRHGRRQPRRDGLRPTPTAST